MKIISRKEANSLGLTHYFTGKPCLHGHISERWVSTGQCVECRKENNACEKNKERLRVYGREYYAKNIEKKRLYYRDRQRSKIRECPIYSTSCRVRSRVGQAFRKNGYSKNTKTAEMLGCSWEELKTHIERQFTIGMSWDNRSQWHIDHIVPLASAKDESEVIALCHYTNLRPMWAGENIAKSDKREYLL